MTLDALCCMDVFVTSLVDGGTDLCCCGAVCCVGLEWWGKGNVPEVLCEIWLSHSSSARIHGGRVSEVGVGVRDGGAKGVPVRGGVGVVAPESSRSGVMLRIFGGNCVCVPGCNGDSRSIFSCGCC